MQRNIIVTAGLAAVLGLATISCSDSKQAVTEQRPIAVNVEVITPSSEQVVRTFTGALEGKEQAVLFAKLAESVEKVHVREGQHVKAGQTLISMDKYGPSARYNEALSVYKNDEKNFKKMEYLYKEGAVSETQFDGARTQFEVSKANFEAVQRLVEIQSPIDGIVTGIDVAPGAQVTMGQRLATVATTDSLRVKFGVNADVIGDFAIGAAVDITSDLAAQPARGKVVALAGSADPGSRSFEVEALVDGTGGLYRPGMFVKVLLVRERLENVLVIPREAVVILDNQPVVYVAEGNIAKKRPVTLGVELDGHVVISSGLNPGDTVVTLGQTYLDEGFKITIANVKRGQA